jgi:hypothetical protein
VIADHLVGSDIDELVDEDGTARTLSDAFAYHAAQQIHARMNGEDMMDSDCTIWGIQDHGGIPDELRGGSSGCDATYVLEDDLSLTYQHAQVQSLVAHAELLLRRGDTSAFDNETPSGMGSIRQSILFVVANPTMSWPWTEAHYATLEIAYRYYRDADLCMEFGCENPTPSGSNRVLSFGTLTHGFDVSEDPGPPPTVPPP